PSPAAPAARVTQRQEKILHDVLGGFRRPDETEHVLAQIDIVRLERRFPRFGQSRGRAALRGRECGTRRLRHMLCVGCDQRVGDGSFEIPGQGWWDNQLALSRSPRKAAPWRPRNTGDLTRLDAAKPPGCAAPPILLNFSAVML